MGTRKGDGAQFDPHAWWRKGSGQEPRVEHLTPDGDLVPYPDKPCLCGGLGLTVPKVDCGAGFQARACWCICCARSQMRDTLDYALGLDVLKAEEQGDGFYTDNDQGIG